MSKNFRVARERIKAAGLEVEALEATGKSHIRARCRRADGAEKTFIFASTTKNFRSIRNACAESRRFSRGAEHGG